MSVIYQSLNDYCRHKFGKKLYKISLQSGCTCPNRDGTLDTRGCIFCSAGGSGDFAAPADLPIHEQLAAAKSRIAGKMPKTGGAYIAYFQSYTNTYGDIKRLSALWQEAAADAEIEVISIATRPDCLDDAVLTALAALKKRKPVWVELGLQTIHEATASYIRRGYPLSCYKEAVQKLHALKINVITHVILGLPGETSSDMLATIDYIVQHAVDEDGIKLQLLHVLKGTDLAKDYENGSVPIMEPEIYFQLLLQCLERIPPSMVVHRLTGDGPKNLLIAPKWTGNKRLVLNTLQRKLTEMH